MYSYAREKIKDCLDEALPLLEAHWKEVAFYPDIVLEPDREAYYAMESLGCVACFVVRDEDSHMIGYAVYFMRKSLHYKNSLQASNDIIYLNPTHRKLGLAGDFISWCDKQLKELGVQVVSHHIKSSHNWGRLIERQGYQLQDLIYTKRLDR